MASTFASTLAVNCYAAPMATHQTLDGLVSDYLRRREGQIAKSTHNSLRSCLTRLSGWWDGKPHRKVPKSMTEADLTGYLWNRHKCSKACGGSGRWHRGPGLRDSCSDGKFNGDLGRLRGFLEWAVRYGHMRPEVLEPVGHGQQVKLKRKRRRRLSPDLLSVIVTGAPDPWTRVVCSLAIFTAGRSSELLSLTVGDIDLEDGVIEWNRHKTRDDGDYLPITSDLAYELELWMKVYDDECGPLKPWHYLIPRRTRRTTKGRNHVWVWEPDRRRGDNLHKIIKPELARALDCSEGELLQEGVHTLRRSMARALYERLRDEGDGDPIGVVQALLGHTQRAMTEKYIGVESGRERRDTLLRGRSMFGTPEG